MRCHRWRAELCLRFCEAMAGRAVDTCGGEIQGALTNKAGESSGKKEGSGMVSSGVQVTRIPASDHCFCGMWWLYGPGLLASGVGLGPVRVVDVCL